jgi:hypothetical protein
MPRDELPVGIPSKKKNQQWNDLDDAYPPDLPLDEYQIEFVQSLKSKKTGGNLQSAAPN